MKKLFIIPIIIFLFSCSKDKVNPDVGPITIEFDNVFTEDLDLTIDYNVSNLQLKRDDGAVYTDGLNSHHVSEADEGSQEISLKDVPAGNYTQVSFKIESLKVSGSLDYTNASATVVLAMPGTGAPVRAEHEPEAHLIFNMNTLKDGGDVSSAFVVDHVHAN
ncbi:MAG: MbnP family protein [Bacteroidota bacterium]